MLTKITRISTIKSFEIISGFAVKNQCLVNLSDSNFELKEPKIVFVKHFGELTIGLDSLNKPVFLKPNQQDHSLYNEFRIDSIKFPYISYYKKTDPRTYGVYNQSESKTEFETTEWIGRDFHGEFIFGNNNKTIECRKISSSDLVWSFHLSSLSTIPHTDNYKKDAPWEVKKIIGVLEKKLWLALNHHTIIALSLVDGTLKHFIYEIPDFHCEWLPAAIPLSEATILSEADNKLIGLMWEFYWEIDPKTGSIILQDHTSYFKENRVRNDREHYVLDKELIFFLSDNDSKAACFNKETQKLDWQYTFEKNELDEFPRLTEIQGDRMKLGVKDVADNLYVFEN